MSTQRCPIFLGKGQDFDVNSLLIERYVLFNFLLIDLYHYFLWLSRRVMLTYIRNEKGLTRKHYYSGIRAMWYFGKRLQEIGPVPFNNNQNALNPPQGLEVTELKYQRRSNQHNNKPRISQFINNLESLFNFKVGRLLISLTKKGKKPEKQVHIIKDNFITNKKDRQDEMMTTCEQPQRPARRKGPTQHYDFSNCINLQTTPPPSSQNSYTAAEKQDESRLLQKFFEKVGRHAGLRKRQIFSLLKMHYQVVKQLDAYIDNQIVQLVFEMGDRNEAITSGHALFLVLFAIILSMLQANSNAYKNSSYIAKSIQYILKKMQQPSIRYQVHHTVYESLFQMVAVQRSYRELHEYMRFVLLTEKELMIRTIPYYHDLCVLIVNQNIYFRQSKEVALEYTVPFSFPTVDRKNVTCQIVRSAFDQLQALLVEKYHSKDI